LFLTPLSASVAAPSPWVQRWAHLIAPGGTVLDVACGSGRHARWLAARGFQVTGVDRDTAALAGLRSVVGESAELVAADIESGPWPFAGRRFDAVVVTNYLWRALLPTLVQSLNDGGVLIYETFADGNQTVGKPLRPDFLLQPGELLRVAEGLRTVAYEHGFLDAPPRFVQRIAAVAPAAAAGEPPRHSLLGPPGTHG
jgi:SAM-dependent methyltransferase